MKGISSDEMIIKQNEKDRQVKSIKGGPMFQNWVTCKNNVTTEKVTMVGCKVINTVSNIYYSFIIPSKFSNSYYVGFGRPNVNKEINTIKLLTFVNNIKLEEEERDINLKGIFKPICS